MTAQPLLQFGTVALDPAPDGRVVRFQAALAEQFFDIAERERVPKVPAHGAHNQLGLGLSPLEDRRSDCLLHDRFRLPAPSATVATQPLGLTQRSVEDETERQGGFDGEIGILELPAPPADASRCPRGDRVGREPEGDVASPHEGSVVLGPVPDAIRCLVLRMHSRLHIEIMTRRRSRWSTCRPLLAHRAESAHQRPPQLLLATLESDEHLAEWVVA